MKRFVTLWMVMFWLVPKDLMAQDIGKLINQAAELSGVKLQIEENKSPENESTEVSSLNFGSLMFLPKELEQIEKAEKARDTKVPIEILMPELFGNQVAGDVNTPKPTVTNPDFQVQTQPSESPSDFIYEEPQEMSINPADTPVYYLRSILYLSSDNWTIWLADKKISSQDEIQEISDDQYGAIVIAHVEPRKVIALWEGFPTQLISPDFRDFAYDLGGGIYASQDLQLVYDSTKQKMAFILQTNQAIVPYILSIIDGKQNAQTALLDATSTEKLVEEELQETTQEKVTLEEVKPAAIPENLGSLDSTMDSEHMKQYLKQIDMLQSLLQQAN